MFASRHRLRVAGGVAAIAVVAMVAAACGSTSNNSSTSTKYVSGAVATIPNVTGSGANCIFPMETTACYSVANYSDFMDLMFRPLYMFGGNNNSITVNYALSTADKPIYTDGGKTVVINLKPWKWSNGETVDAKDLIFFLNMLEAEKINYAGYTPDLLPDNVTSYQQTGTQQVTLHLKTAYSSLWYTYNQLAILYPFPMAWDVTHAGAAAGSGGCTTDTAADGWAKCKAVWTYLNSQNKDTSTYATNPLWQVVNGPFRLTSYNVSGAYNFVPNPKYSGSPKPSIAELKFVVYTSTDAIYTALKTGALSQGPIPSTDLTKAGPNYLPATNPLASAPNGGYWLQAQEEFGIGYAYENFNNPTYGPVFKQLYFRQAMMMLDNQVGMNTSVGRGYSVSTVAGVPSVPVSQWISPAMKANGGQGPYPYNPTKAKALLAAHGWKVVSNVLTCESSACGAGIKVGTQAKFSMQYSSGASTQADDVDILKSGLAQAGIQLSAAPETFDSLLADLTPCTPSESRCSWTFLYLGAWLFNGPGFEPTGEPLYATGAVNNSGSYSNAKMDSLINATHTSSSLSTFYAYANYTAQQLPVLFMPLGTTTFANSNGLHDVTQSPVLMFFPEYWKCTTKTC